MDCKIAVFASLLFGFHDAPALWSDTDDSAIKYLYLSFPGNFLSDKLNSYLCAKNTLFLLNTGKMPRCGFQKYLLVAGKYRIGHVSCQ